MFDKLEEVEKKYEELSEKLISPEVISDGKLYSKYAKEHAEIAEVVEKFREYKKTLKEKEEAESLMKDPEMKELAEMELYEAKEKLPKLEEELKILLIPKDPNEIRAGAGGEEAALFAGTLFRMYSMYAERKRFKLEVLNVNETGMGGYKEITFMVSGKGAYSRLKFESGVHRVQRVPDTESSRKSTYIYSNCCSTSRSRRC